VIDSIVNVCSKDQVGVLVALKSNSRSHGISCGTLNDKIVGTSAGVADRADQSNILGARIASWGDGAQIFWGKLDVDRYTRKEYRKQTGSEGEMAMSKCFHLARVDDRESWLARRIEQIRLMV
jgi:hypothetical protein